MGAIGGLIGWLVIGVIAGFCADTVLGGDTSLGNDLGVGTFGAFIGGIIIQLLPFLHGPQSLIGSLIVAFAGACCSSRPGGPGRCDGRSRARRDALSSYTNPEVPMAVTTPAENADGGEVARWPATVAVLLVGGLYLFISGRYAVGPAWLVLAVGLALVVPFWLARRAGRHGLSRGLALAVNAFLTLAVAASAALLIVRLGQGTIQALARMRQNWDDDRGHGVLRVA